MTKREGCLDILHTNGKSESPSSTQYPFHSIKQRGRSRSIFGRHRSVTKMPLEIQTVPENWPPSRHSFYSQHDWRPLGSLLEECEQGYSWLCWFPHTVARSHADARGEGRGIKSKKVGVFLSPWFTERTASLKWKLGLPTKLCVCNFVI